MLKSIKILSTKNLQPKFDEDKERKINMINFVTRRRLNT